MWAQSLAKSGRADDAAPIFDRLIETSTSTETLLVAAEFYFDRGRASEARELALRILARRATMPAYQKRRERPWLRRAAALLKSVRADTSVAA